MTFHKIVFIQASPSTVWKALTTNELVECWMSEEEIEITTDWKAGSAINIKGHQHLVHFENSGKILQAEPERILQYSHLSSLSKLPDVPESYSIITFLLSETSGSTSLTLTLSGFPTESIHKHLVFYWNTTLDLLKSFIEGTNP